MSEYLPSFIVEPVLRQARRFSERLGTDEQQTAHSAIAGDRGSPAAAETGIGVPEHLIASNSRFGLPNLAQLPSVPAVDLQRFYPSRFWNQSPPPSTAGEHKSTETTVAAVDDEDAPLEEGRESTLQSIARNIQLWANQINNLDMFPSPPLEAGQVPLERENNDGRVGNQMATDTIEFPPLDVEVPQQPPPPISRTTDIEVEHHPSRTDSETSANPANELSYRSRIIEQRDNGRSHSDPLTAPNTGQNITAAVTRDVGIESTRERDWSGSLPEDDGMGPLRKRINAIWEGPGTPQDKSRLVHSLMTERYRQGQISKSQAAAETGSSYRPLSPSSISTVSQDGAFNLFPLDLEPTFAPRDTRDGQHDPSSDSSKPVLGCMHYKRNVKMQCNTCERWYTCRLCHDEVEDHQLPRRETKHMLCMVCGTPQRVGQDCRLCGTQAACYYCPTCKLWNNDPEKSIYHCDDCGICRLGEGLGKDFFHCKTCAACMSIQAESTHKCIEKSTKCDCPICGEYMFTSNKPVAFMRCGHSIHETCFGEWCNTSYKCPICSKSIANMESQFRRLDRHIEEQPMPEEYSNNRAYISCNDCNSRSVTKYHWLGLKCAVCDSYNTAQLELLGAESPQIQARANQAQQMGVGEAGITASQSQTPTEELTEPASEPNSGRITPSEPHRTSTFSNSGNTEVPAAHALARSPPSGRDSPFHNVPQSPPNRSTRSFTPTVGNYFNTSQTRPANENRRGSYFSVFSAGSNRDNTEDIAATLSPGLISQNDPRRRVSSRLSQSYQAEPSTDAPSNSYNNSRDIATVPIAGGSAISQDIPRRGTIPLDDDEDLDFWGGQSPRSYEAELVDAPHVKEFDEDDEDGSSSEDEFEKMNDDDDDDDEGDDLMDIMGHR